MEYKEIDSNEDLLNVLKLETELSYYAFQNIDFNNVLNKTKNLSFYNCIFLGCTIPEHINTKVSEDCLIFPQIKAPFNPFINSLYTKETLYTNYKVGVPESYEKTLDKIVYNHFIEHGKEAKDIKETLTRRLHDHSVTNALNDFISNYKKRKIVAIMGGHSLSRSNSNYLMVARISKKLTELGYLMISGGGPGAMEATHVGAWFGGKTDKELTNAIDVLSEAPVYNDKLWLDKAFEVLEKYPKSSYKSLGIPTWLYGHEPPTPFASHIAKYFANSVREEGLLAIAKGGVIFSPGSAGTIQEIFQDATQNHYLSYGFASPMVFLNKEYWTKNRPIYPLLENLTKEEKYKNMILSIYDLEEDVIKEIEKFPKS
ncbi:Predicted Rossmann fold nucleotide-binding protein [Lutibacter oricola]|uniref:Predicted Rossmann fold nucleotide-binding protein n=1 Tax=Lutibacter oricola TaxID=762486 RepID=A0A1H2XMB9_9FLAO|nr:hypothetical protein [Lutibacter oricola]SDW94053.1 Predicted Rossmann fold nucleotide-binding protein [Lutibacter oricola]